MKYLTPSLYRLSDDGQDLTGVTDITLASMINRAESAIDAYMGFDPKNGGFEPHTVWTQSQLDERTLRTHSPNAPVPVRRVVRYRIQVSNLSNTGAGFFANISNADAAINVFDEYIEIVPLQSITYSLAPVLIQLGLRPPIVQMDVEIGFYIATYSETLYLTTTTGLYTALRGFWTNSYTQSLASQPNTLPPVPPNIYVNGVLQNASAYTLNLVEGQVLFTVPPSTNATITADYSYTIPDPVYTACIDQVTHLLALRAINQKGLKYLSGMQVGDVQISNRGVALPGDSTPLTSFGLCKPAREKLDQYIPLAVA